MAALGRFAKRLISDRFGISSVEYALMLAFVAGGIVVGATALSGAVGEAICAAALQIDPNIAGCQAAPPPPG